MLLQAGISPRVGTSPLWSSCAASSKCSCKQAFLLCRYFAPLELVRRLVEMLLQAGISPCVGTSPRWGSCAASSKCSCKQAFLLASDGMTVWVLTVSCPLATVPQKRFTFLREPCVRGDKGGIVNAKCRAGRTIPQSLRDSSLYRVPAKIFKFLWDVAREPSYYVNPLYFLPFLMKIPHKYCVFFRELCSGERWAQRGGRGVTAGAVFPYRVGIGKKIYKMS